MNMSGLSFIKYNRPKNQIKFPGFSRDADIGSGPNNQVY